MDYVLAYRCVFLMLALSGLGSAHNLPDGFTIGQAQTTYYVDLLAIVDDAMYNKWLSMYPGANVENLLKNYVSMIVHQANKRLSTMQLHLNYDIQLKIKEFRIGLNLLSGIEANQLTNRRSAEKALTTLRTFVAFNSELDSGFDHVILFTGYDLEDSYEGSQLVSGKAYVSAMCRKGGQSVSVVESLGGYTSSFTTAHELAHSLGSRHDGENNACSKANRYLMVADDSAPRTDSNQDHPWYMSQCSATAINTYVQEILQEVNGLKNCLTSTSPAAPEFMATKSQVPGQLNGPHEQCKMLMGDHSQLCVGASFGAISDICTNMYCLQSGEVCAGFYAAEGTSCGNQMWCEMGRCVYSTNAPAFQNPDCPFGDSLITINGQNCATFIANNVNQCYKENIRSNCCQTCESFKRNNPACPYGDQAVGCDRNSCDYIYPDGRRYDQLCCDTCSYDGNNQCTDVASINGMSCADRVQQGGYQNCYDGSVAFQCCATCNTLRRYTVKDCEYGDRLLSCSARVTDPTNCTAEYKQMCCNTCKSSQTNGANLHSVPGLGLGFLVIAPLLFWRGGQIRD